MCICDQVLNDQVVINALGVLKIADRIHPDGMGNLPGSNGQRFNRRERVGIKCITALRTLSSSNSRGRPTGFLSDGFMQ